MGVAAAEVPGPPVEPAEGTAWVGDVIKDMVAAMITTIDATGIMHTRQVPNTNAGFNGNLSFLASAGTALVEEVAAHPDVLVTYADPGARRFVVLNGVARLRQDLDQVRALWRPTLASWFPAGSDCSALALIEVSVESVDLWE